MKTKLLTLFTVFMSFSLLVSLIPSDLSADSKQKVVQQCKTKNFAPGIWKLRIDPIDRTDVWGNAESDMGGYYLVAKWNKNGSIKSVISADDMFWSGDQNVTVQDSTDYTFYVVGRAERNQACQVVVAMTASFADSNGTNHFVQFAGTGYIDGDSLAKNDQGHIHLHNSFVTYYDGDYGAWSSAARAVATMTRLTLK
tara:strand:+ start:3144 stop:3734 length:591 start_codon:yes stop_codon:yes gene_type:complete